jgi:hypothetical protein
VAALATPAAPARITRRALRRRDGDPPARQQARPSPAAVAVAEEEDDELAMDPYIETERCTTCNECTNLNSEDVRLRREQAGVHQGPKAGTFRELVLAAEKCPAELIHPGTPLNPKEKDLAKWVERAPMTGIRSFVSDGRAVDRLPERRKRHNGQRSQRINGSTDTALNQSHMLNFLTSWATASARRSPAGQRS